MTTAFVSNNSDSDSKHDFKIELILMIGGGGGGGNEIRSVRDRDGENNRLSFLYHHPITSSLY